MRSPLLSTSLVLLAFAGAASAAETPSWIWSSPTASDGQAACFRKSFTVAEVPASAKVYVTGDNHAVVWVNGVQVGKTDEWKEPAVVEVAKHLKAGANVIAVEGRNDDGIAAMVAKLVLKDKAGKTTEVVSDASWKTGSKTDGWEKAGFDDAAWKGSADLGKLGKDPWGDVFAGAKPGGGASILAADQLSLQPGFKAEVIYTVPKGEQGSWVSLCADPKGRLIASDQNGALYRITPCAPGADPETTKVEKLDVAAGSAQGLLWAHDSLYVTISGKYANNGSGIYRLQDTDNNDSFDKVTKLKAIDGSGEHGPHGLALGPDGMIYFSAGNFTKLPEPFDTYLPPKIWQEDILLPRLWDANGHAKGTMAPGGWIARFNADGTKWDLVGIGYRNSYDVAFNLEGDLFSYDSDMEWDMGTPWYRPTRATHNVLGADYGWRSGSGNPPNWFVDSMPPLMDIGPGSPVGVAIGTGAKFPAKYQKALYLLDWTFGTVYALHLEPQGATYKATKEEFVFGRPLPLTDVAVATDGAMYITIGGRGTQSGLYRITYSGTESTAPVKAAVPTPEATLRRKLEALLGKADPAATSVALANLGHADRIIRFVAREVLEHQPVAEWKDKVFAEKNPHALITGLVALARCGDKALLNRACEAWLAIDLAKLTVDDQLDALRAASLIITRLGQPDPATALRMATVVDPLFPSKDWRLNRDAASMIAILGSPTAVTKILDQMQLDESLPANPDLARLIERNGGYGGPIAQMVASKPISQRMHYANALSVVKNGWTPDQRKAYFTWFETAQNEAKGGNSFKGFIRMIRDAAMQNVPEAERAAYAPDKLASGPKPVVAPLVQPKGPGKEWTVDAAAALAQKGMKGRDFANGKAMYNAVQCSICHRFANEGAAVGPDLSSVGTKFSARDLLESIIEPSKVISDQYQSQMLITKDGAAISGKVVGEENGELLIAISPLDASLTTKVKKADVVSTTPIKVSTMPPGLLNRLNQDELLDLLAYLISGGNEQDKMFAK
jgi:putative heme-binding domain-containing protein